MNFRQPLYVLHKDCCETDNTDFSELLRVVCNDCYGTDCVYQLTALCGLKRLIYEQATLAYSLRTAIYISGTFTRRNTMQVYVMPVSRSETANNDGPVVAVAR